MKRKLVTAPPEQLDLHRILSLPIRSKPDVAEVEIQSFLRMSAEEFSRGERLLPSQVDALTQFEEVRGGFFPVGVGFGKSGIALMASQIACDRGWARKILLLVPVHLVQGLFKRHIPEWRRRVNLSLTFHSLTGKSKAQRKVIAESGAAGVYIMPYSLMSQADAVDILRAIDADMVVSDEGHRLKNLRSACAKRLFEVMEEQRERGKSPIFVTMSGSFMSKSIMEYHHLIVAALAAGAPVPLRASTAYTWGLVVDSGASPTHGLVAGSMGKLIDWAHKNSPPEQQKLFSSRVGVENARNAYGKRLTTAPGVVATGEERPSASLAIINREVPAHGKELASLIFKVQETYTTPQGEPIDHAIHTYKWLSELSFGFYNSLVWPTAEQHAHNRKISVAEAEDRLSRARFHLKAEQVYHGALRDFFKESPLGLDTPLEVAQAIALGKSTVPQHIHGLWHEMKNADFVGRPDRYEVPIRVDDFKVRACIDWAKEFKTGLIWVLHIEAGKWLCERLREAGLDPVYAPAGADDLIESIGDPSRGGKGDRLVVASIPAHGVGRNLQAFEHQLFAEWPRSEMLAEQTLGRVHRTGQKAEEVVVHTLISDLEFDRHNRAATINDSVCVNRTMVQARRVLYADYDPPPEIYHPGVLRRKGMSPSSGDPQLWDWVRGIFHGKG